MRHKRHDIEKFTKEGLTNYKRKSKKRLQKKKFTKEEILQKKKKDLQNMAHLSSSVIAKMGKDQPVNLDTIVKICVALQCDISDVVTLCNKEA